MSLRSLLILVPTALLFAFACTPELDEGRNEGDCIDGADNDGDGYFDCNDPGCSGAPACEEGVDDDDAVFDDDDGAPDDDDDVGFNVLLELADDPGLGATTPNGTALFVFVMDPAETNDGFPFGEPGDRVDGVWADGFSGGVSIPFGATVVLVALIDVDGDEEICTAGDHHGYAEVTATEEVQTVSIPIVNVLEGTECERDGKPKE